VTGFLRRPEYLPKTPKLKYAVGPEPHFAVPNGGTVRLLAELTHTYKSYSDVENTELLARKAADLIDASASFVSPGGKLTVTIGGTNLNDERYITTGQAQVAGGVIYGTYNAPREWYATLSVKF
jgi:iron complex outermembrane receptor protein